MKIDHTNHLTFDDVLIKPQYSEVLPSETTLATKFSRNVELQIPIASSAMDTVTESKMAIAMAELGGIGVIHKNLKPQEQATEVEKVKAAHKKFPVAAAIGVGPKELKRAELLAAAGVSVLIVDTAHGHSKGVLEMVAKLKNLYPKNLDIVAGNVATANACQALLEVGVDGIKVGIGPGSICTTRVVAGVGVPQFQALVNCSTLMKDSGVPFIADGGIRHSGDIVKALATGANCVMLGSLLAGTDMSPSELIEYEGKSFKRYRGMGSLTAMSLGSKDRYAQGDVENTKKLVPEGIEGLTPYKGSLNDVVYQLTGGLRSGLGYVGAKNLEGLYQKCEFIKVTGSTLKENHPHDIIIDIGAPNY
ncbi:MAG: IMP dehydrogenase [Halobacteriovoraceae bacterium]|nr:IMP dehydrogenase [Halobacteriovoraceae bacterium]MCB9095094.1 IMP dehydrogenase [Halobacteriovoraceae bacterium]